MSARVQGKNWILKTRAERQKAKAKKAQKGKRQRKAALLRHCHLVLKVVITHARGKITFRVQVPENAQLDFGMRTLQEEVPVTFRIRRRQVVN